LSRMRVFGESVAVGGLGGFWRAMVGVRQPFPYRFDGRVDQTRFDIGVDKVRWRFP
jgi:hypothetical protein